MSPNKPKEEKPKQEKPAVNREALAKSIKDKKKALASNQIIKK
jgi:hypothetical protein